MSMCEICPHFTRHEWLEQGKNPITLVHQRSRIYFTRESPPDVTATDCAINIDFSKTWGYKESPFTMAVSYHSSLNSFRWRSFMLLILKIILASIIFISCSALVKVDPLILASSQLSQTGTAGMTILFSGTITNLGPLPAGPGGELAIFIMTVPSFQIFNSYFRSILLLDQEKQRQLYRSFLLLSL